MKLSGKTIQRVNCAKFLGIFLDGDLQWEDYIKHVSRKLSSGAYALNSVKKILSRSNLRQLYFSLIHSHMSYGLLLWGSAFENQLRKIITIQKRTLRNVANAPYNSHTSPLFKDLDIPKFPDLFKIQICKMMY